MRKCDAKEGVFDPVKSDLITLEYDAMSVMFRTLFVVYYIPSVIML